MSYHKTHKSLAALAVATLFAAAPAASLAQQNVQDDAETIQSLSRQVQELKKLLDVLAAAFSDATPSASNFDPRSADLELRMQIVRTLRYGSRGDDVRSLQRFLISRGFLTEDAATGFFGSQTEAAVQAYQRANNIISAGSPATTGFGVVGPKTRRFILAESGAAGVQDREFGQTQGDRSDDRSVVPGSSGSAGTISPKPWSDTFGTLSLSPNPVAVGATLKATVGIRQQCNQARDAYTITWGDGTAATNVAATPGNRMWCEAADMPVYLSHTHAYSRAGTYTVTLTTGGKTATQQVVVR